MLEKIQSYFDLVFGTAVWIIVSSFTIFFLLIILLIHLIFDEGNKNDLWDFTNSINVDIVNSFVWIS